MHKIKAAITTWNAINTINGTAAPKSPDVMNTVANPQEQPHRSKIVIPIEIPAVLLVLTISNICGRNPIPNKALGTMLPREIANQYGAYSHTHQDPNTRIPVESESTRAGRAPKHDFAVASTQVGSEWILYTTNWVSTITKDKALRLHMMTRGVAASC